MSVARTFVAVVLVVLGSAAVGQDDWAGRPRPDETPAVPGGDGLAPPIMNAREREVFDLDGEWRVIVDRFEHGTLNYLSEPRGDGWWRDRERERPEELIEYDFDTAETMTVPGDWNTQDERLFFYEGTVWYRRTFDPVEAGLSPGRRHFIRFGAVNRHATVWLNGERLGSHHVGFTPFAFEVTGKMRVGENSLVVRVDNRRRAEDVPALRTDWWNYGGITREVSLVETPRTFARSWALTLDGDEIEAVVEVDGPDVGPDGGGGLVTVTVEGVKVGRARVVDGRARLRLPTEGRLERWSPGSPRLYDVRVEFRPGRAPARGFELEVDAVRDRVGFREIETRGRAIVLNGEPVFLRGICLHEEALVGGDGAGGGRAWSEAHARELLGLAKGLGVNFVRLAHYTHNEAMVRVADELGLMVWAEIPVYWEMDFENAVTAEYARAHLTEMVERDRNRASVVIWSVGNENRAKPAQTAFRVELARAARELDPSRLISAACFVTQRREDGKLAEMVVEDPFGEVADVLAINQYVGWYGGHTRDLSGVTVRTAWEKPLVFSEFGAGVKAGLRGDSDEVWTEEFGVRFYRDQLDWCDELRATGSLQGISPWILKDFRSPRRMLGGVQDGWNRKGLVSEMGDRKDVFGVVRERYERLAGEDGG